MNATRQKKVRAAWVPEVIGDVVWRALTSPRPKVRYPAIPNRLINWTLPRLIPMKLLDVLVARFMGIKKKGANGGALRGRWARKTSGKGAALHRSDRRLGLNWREGRAPDVLKWGVTPF